MRDCPELHASRLEGARALTEREISFVIPGCLNLNLISSDEKMTCFY